MELVLLSPAYTALIREHHSTYTGDTASPKHQHHTSISTRSSPYIAEFEQFLIAVQKGFHIKYCLGGCDEVQAISVLASSLRASTHHGGGYWVVPSSSRVLFFVTMRPWCFRHLLWGVGLMWVLGCPVVIVVGC